MKKNEWFVGIPETSGIFWFYGNPYKGQAISDYNKVSPPDDLKMYLITVVHNKHNVLLTVDGQFIKAAVFDKENRTPGVYGYFKSATLPPAPTDALGLFSI